MLLPTNPWDAIKRDSGKSIRYQPFTLEELDALRRIARVFSSQAEPDFWPCAIEIGYYTGLRLGDIATLDWSELHFDDHYLILAPNKTKHWGDDRVAVHSLSLPWIKMLPAKPADAAGPIWPKAAGLYNTNKGTVLSEEFSTLANAAGIQLDREAEEGERRQRNVKIKTFHSLRHTFATEILKDGVEMDVLTAQGNWTDTKVINEHYNHAKLERAKAAADKIAASIGRRITKEDQGE